MLMKNGIDYLEGCIADYQENCIKDAVAVVINIKNVIIKTLKSYSDIAYTITIIVIAIA